MGPGSACAMNSAKGTLQATAQIQLAENPSNEWPHDPGVPGWAGPSALQEAISWWAALARSLTVLNLSSVGGF